MRDHPNFQILKNLACAGTISSPTTRVRINNSDHIEIIVVGGFGW
jgi:hypothetical protein